MTSPSKFAPGGVWWSYDQASPEVLMPHRAADLGGFLRLTGVVAQAGSALPPDFLQLRERFLEFSRPAAGHAPVLFDRLADTIVTGTGDPALLFAAVMAERGHDHPERRHEVLAQLHDTIGGRLRDLYAPVALKTYCQLAAAFDKTCEQFTRCANTVDPAAPAEQVVDADKRTLDAWRQAAVLAARLDELLEPLSAAAELLRPLNLPSGHGVSRAPLQLPLVCDSEGLHRRVIWHAFHDWAPPKPPGRGLTVEGFAAPPTDVVQNTRCGRWARLVAAGAHLRANPNPVTMEMFGRPQPIGLKSVAGRTKAVLVHYDPEGELPVEAPKRGPLERLRAAFKRSPDEPDPRINILDTVLGDSDEGK